jgi:hypothetical protein
MLLLAAPLQEGEGGYSFPAEHRGEMTAELSVRIPEQGPAPGLARAQLTLRVTGPPSSEVDGPRLEDALAGWRVQWAASSWSEHDGWALWVQTLDLVQVKPGVVPLPGVSLRLRAGAAETWEEVSWPELLQEPRPAPTIEAQPPLPPSPWPRRLGFAAYLLGGSVGLALLVRALLRLRAAQKRPLSAHDRALARLDQTPADPAAAAAHMDGLLRDYVSERFAVPAGRMTKTELIATLQENPDLPAAQREELADVLAWCELGKFANVEVDGAREAGSRARRFVEATVPVAEGKTGRKERKPGETRGDAKEG